MTTQEKHPHHHHHFALLPFMAQGHMIPMVDIARLLAKRGVTITILITPKNHNRIKSIIDRAITAGSIINISHLKFPNVEAGLPEGCESFDMIPSLDDSLKFFKAAALLQSQVEETLRNLKPHPTCLISDMCYPWTTRVAAKLKIPRLVFHGTSCFSLLCIHILSVSNDFEGIVSDTEYFVVPGLPDRIEITKAQFRGRDNQIPYELIEIHRQMLEGEAEAFGTVSNTFEELEPEYLKEYEKVKGKKVWCVGPVSLCNEGDIRDKAERGNKASIDEHECLKWLDSQEPGSVLFVCLGSLSKLAASQLVELGLGLEASDRPFVWVIRSAASDEFFGKWEEEFEERVRGKGLLIRGWAPQVLILSHPSVGGFLTHCGWNSTLEGITAGLPLLTWPVFAEQFCNEKFIVNVIKTGVRVGVELPVAFGKEEEVGVQVKRGDVRAVIDELMGGGGEERRESERARENSEKCGGGRGIVLPKLDTAHTRCCGCVVYLEMMRSS